MMPSNETLAQRIRRVQQESGLVDPRDLAAKVIADLPDSEVRSALAVALPVYVREIIRVERHHAMYYDDVLDDDMDVASVQQPSRKVAAVREWRRHLLNQGVAAGGVRGDWKRLGDCTCREVLAAASYNRQLAAQNIAMAGRLEALAEHLSDGQRVEDLSEATLREVFGPRSAR